MGRLDGKTAIITGAGRGLGAAYARALAGEGAAITAADIIETGTTVAAITDAGGRAIGVSCDVTDTGQIAAMVAATLEAFGGVDILVNNAALGPQTFQPTNLEPRPPVWEIEVDLWRRILDVNASGPFIMARAVLPHLLERGWGRIINVTTSLDTMWRPGLGAYGPAKACAEAFTASLAADLEGTGVTANVLVPGGRADTRMIPSDGEFADRSLLVARDVMVAPVTWLASDSSDGVNNMRFRAALFDPDLPPEQAAEAAGAPVAWPQLGNQAIR